MKIAGKIPSRVERTIAFAKPCPTCTKGGEKTEATKKCTECKGTGNTAIQVTIRALPLGFEEKVREWAPVPRPKKKWVTKDQRAVYDSNGQPLAEEDILAPEYVASVKRMLQLQGAGYIWEALKGDANVQWTSTPPNDGADAEQWQKFLAALYAEMMAANFTAGDLKALIDEIKEISLEKTELFREVREGFSSGESS